MEIGGGMPHGKAMRSIELLGTEVAPAVRNALGAGGDGAAGAGGATPREAATAAVRDVG
jgi:hypothetical protein